MEKQQARTWRCVVIGSREDAVRHFIDMAYMISSGCGVWYAGDSVKGPLTGYMESRDTSDTFVTEKFETYGTN